MSARSLETAVESTIRHQQHIASSNWRRISRPDENLRCHVSPPIMEASAPLIPWREKPHSTAGIHLGGTCLQLVEIADWASPVPPNLPAMWEFSPRNCRIQAIPRLASWYLQLCFSVINMVLVSCPSMFAPAPTLPANHLPKSSIAKGVWPFGVYACVLTKPPSPPVSRLLARNLPALDSLLEMWARARPRFEML